MPVKTIPLTNLRTHVIIWLVFIAYETFDSFFLAGQRLSNVWDDAGHYSLYILLFYFNAHIALPSTINENRRNYLAYALLLISQLVIFTGLKYALYYSFKYLHIEIYPAPKLHLNFIVTGIIRAVYFLGFSVGYWFVLSTIRNQRKVAELEGKHLRDDIEREQLEAVILTTENAHLKAQINPHFLFNTLNFLYNAISKFNEEIAESVITLADVMRYSLAETDADGKVPLELELDQISHFITLNQARFSNRLHIKFERQGSESLHRIIPLALMTLVENIFKYGDLSKPDNPAIIAAYMDAEKISFTTENLIKKKNTARGYGIGLENLKKRLNTHHKYEFSAERSEPNFRTTLIIWN